MDNEEMSRWTGVCGLWRNESFLNRHLWTQWNESLLNRCLWTMTKWVILEQAPVDTMKWVVVEQVPMVSEEISFWIGGCRQQRNESSLNRCSWTQSNESLLNGWQWITLTKKWVVVEQVPIDTGLGEFAVYNLAFAGRLTSATLSLCYL